MSYYKQVLQAGETVRFVGKLHWFIYKNAIILLLLTPISLYLLSAVPGNLQYARPFALFIFPVLALFSFLRAWFVQITTEIVVTDKRVIHKVGWISRRTEEINISKVETVDVVQGISGRIFGFGSVLIKGIGGSWEPLSHIASPLLLRNAIIVG
jgi:uncharacterized membrane protein YdbT with pleckstrin-like domain